MTKSWLRKVEIIGVTLGIAFARLASAQQGANNPSTGAGGGATTQQVPLPNPLGSNCNDLSCPLNSVINFLFTIAIPLCAIMVLIGGFQMVTAAGNPEKFSKGRKTILYAAAGFAVILLAKGVSTLIQSFFVG